MADHPLTRPTSTTTGLSFLSSGPSTSQLGVVCIPGWACQSSDYISIISLLQSSSSTIAAPLRYVAVDLPGHGSSPTSCSPNPTVVHWGSLINDLAAELNLTRAVIVGHSMGCRTVLAACAHSARSGSKLTVQGVVLLDGSNYSLRPNLFAFDSADPRSAKMSDEDKARSRAEAFERMFSPRTPEAFRKETLAHVQSLDHAYHNRLRRSCVQWDADNMDPELRRLGTAGTPLLVLQCTDVDVQNQRIPLGKEDSKWMKFVRERVPDVTMVRMTESGHFPHIDQSELVATEIAKFLKTSRLIP